jgi:hypothetical protein
MPIFPRPSQIKAMKSPSKTPTPTGTPQRTPRETPQASPRLYRKPAAKDTVVMDDIPRAGDGKACELHREIGPRGHAGPLSFSWLNV